MLVTEHKDRAIIPQALPMQYAGLSECKTRKDTAPQCSDIQALSSGLSGQYEVEGCIKQEIFGRPTTTAQTFCSQPRHPASIIPQTQTLENCGRTFVKVSRAVVKPTNTSADANLASARQQNVCVTVTPGTSIRSDHVHKHFHICALCNPSIPETIATVSLNPIVSRTRRCFWNA